MSTIVRRSFDIVEVLAAHPGGRTLSELATELGIPMSATHRLLADLIDVGCVRREPRHGDFVLTMKLASLGLRFLSAGGIVDVAQPQLDRLAAACAELVRLTVVDGDDLHFVAKAQGATHGLRYDPDMGQTVTLSCSAAGFAWLSTMDDETALRMVARQGFGDPDDFGSKAPTTVKGLLAHLKATRKRGYSVTVDIFAPSMSSMAAPVRDQHGDVVGVLIIAGPMTRLTEPRMLELGPTLVKVADEIGFSSGVSAMFRTARAAPPDQKRRQALRTDTTRSAKAPKR